MKYCTQCSEEIKQEAKFCPFCGGEQIEVIPENKQTSNFEQQVINNQIYQKPLEEAPQTFEKIHSSLNEQLKNNEKIQQITAESKNYFGWLNENIIRPKSALSTNNPLFGFVNYILISLFFSLTFSHNIVRPAYSYVEDKIFPLFFEVFFATALMLIIGVSIVYLTADKVYKNKTSVLQSFDKVFAPASLAVYISLGAFIFMKLMSSVSLLSILLMLSPFLLVNLSVSINIFFTPDKTEQKNRYYTTLLILFIYFILSMVVIFILGDILASTLIGSLESILSFL